MEVKMTLEVDPDVLATAEFLQRNFAATKLAPIAEALAVLAPILWGRYAREAISPLSLSADPISSEPRTLEAAI
jgi:hypothetical protein